MERPLKVAVIGAGPSGLFAAQALTKQDGVPVQVDLFDRLPTPFGLLRYGVAPDHESIKSVARALASVLDDERVRFWGLVELGSDVTRAELQAGYDAIVYAVGAASDVSLGIPGEQLTGSRSARELVSWYDGHPDASAQDLRGVRSVATVGVGNVALDVARILLRREGLDATDMPEAVLEELAASEVRDVWVVGRRGPQHASYTTKELRELLNLPGLRVEVHDARFEEIDDAQLDRRTRANVELLREAAERDAEAAGGGEAGRTLRFAFWRKPIRMEAAAGGEAPERLASLTLERTVLRDGRVVGTGETHDIDVQLVLRAIGYRSNPLPDVPFDTGAAVIPNVEGRVVDPDDHTVVVPREYCVGWVKRGPIGVIGTNKSDAAQTVRHLLDDLEGGDRDAGLVDVPELLRARGHAPSTIEDWRRIDAAEQELGASRGRERTKLATWSELMSHVERAVRD